MIWRLLAKGAVLFVVIQVAAGVVTGIYVATEYNAQMESVLGHVKGIIDAAY